MGFQQQHINVLIVDLSSLKVILPIIVDKGELQMENIPIAEGTNMEQAMSKVKRMCEKDYPQILLVMEVMDGSKKVTEMDIMISNRLHHRTKSVSRWCASNHFIQQSKCFIQCSGKNHPRWRIMITFASWTLKSKDHETTINFFSILDALHIANNGHPSRSRLLY